MGAIQLRVTLHERLYRLVAWLRVAAARLRAHRLRTLAGCRFGAKCLVGPGVRLERPWRIRTGERCVLQPGVWLSVLDDEASLDIGAFTFLGRDCQIEVTRSVTIGRGVLIGPRVYVTDHNHGMASGTPIFEQPCLAKPVRIHDDVWIGAHAIILPGVTIGSGAVVAAGAVVTRDIPARAIVGGVPARVLRIRD